MLNGSAKKQLGLIIAAASTLGLDFSKVANAEDLEKQLEDNFVDKSDHQATQTELEQTQAKLTTAEAKLAENETGSSAAATELTELKATHETLKSENAASGQLVAAYEGVFGKLDASNEEKDLETQAKEAGIKVGAKALIDAGIEPEDIAPNGEDDDNLVTMEDFHSAYEKAGSEKEKNRIWAAYQKAFPTNN